MSVRSDRTPPRDEGLPGWVELSGVRRWSGEACIAWSPVGERRRAGARGAASCSASSMIRLRRYVENSVMDYPVLVTLTYGEHYPEPREAKADLTRFLRSLRRDSTIEGAVWVMEFQRRGAVHFHVLLAAAYVPYAEVAERWHAATRGSSSVAAGTRTERVRGGRAGAGRYLGKYLSKQHSKGADGWTGRYWGVVGPRDQHPGTAVRTLNSGAVVDVVRDRARASGQRFLEGKYWIWFPYLTAEAFDRLLDGLGCVDAARLERPRDLQGSVRAEPEAAEVDYS